MKLKITDEKLDELAFEYVSKNFESDSESDQKTYSDGFRAAEQVHQVTVDKLMQIIEMQKEALSWCPRYDISVNPPMELYSFRKTQAVTIETDKMLKELKSVE